jgi:hypothetical protein
VIITSTPGANPKITSYNASGVKIYDATKKLFFSKFTNAGVVVVVVKSEVVVLDTGANPTTAVALYIEDYVEFFKKEETSPWATN